MPNIKKRGIYIISLVLIIIILIIAFLIFEGGENFLNNNIQTINDDQRNVNLQDNLIDDSGNVINRVGEPCNFRDGSDSQFIKEGDDPERIQAFYENGIKTKEIVYNCTYGKNGTKFIDQERFYRENGMLDKVVGYIDCDGLGCSGHYNFLGIDGTRPYDNYQYKEGTKVFEIFFHEEQVAPIKEGWLYNNKRKHIDYYEDGKTKKSEVVSYRLNRNGIAVEDNVILYYENGAKYAEVDVIDVNTSNITYYHPNGRTRIAETETHRRTDGSTERTKQWFVDGNTEYIETYYDSKGNKTREITRLEGCPYCFVFEGTVRQIYKEDVEFRVNGTISKITSYFMYTDGVESKLVTEYGEHNNILRQSRYNLRTNELLESRNYNIYTDIKDFDKIISKLGITEQQKQNAIKNAGLFMSVCDYEKGSLLGISDEFIKVGDTKSFRGNSLGEYVLSCGQFGYFTTLATIIDNNATESNTSIYDDWKIGSFTISDRWEFYKNKIYNIGV